MQKEKKETYEAPQLETQELLRDVTASVEYCTKSPTGVCNR
jgi:hypothetical protein